MMGNRGENCLEILPNFTIFREMASEHEKEEIAVKLHFLKLTLQKLELEKCEVKATGLGQGIDLVLALPPRGSEFKLQQPHEKPPVPVMQHYGVKNRQIPQRLLVSQPS